MSKVIAAKKPARTVRRTAPLRMEAFHLCSRVMLVQGGKDFFSMLKEHIRQAQHTIHFQIYVFDDDETGTMIADELIAAVKRKVEVFLLVDGYASQSLK